MTCVSPKGIYGVNRLHVSLVLDVEINDSVVAYPCLEGSFVEQVLTLTLTCKKTRVILVG